MPFNHDDMMPGVPSDVQRDIMQEAMPGEFSEPEPTSGCYSCGREDLVVEVVLAFSFEPIISSIHEEYNEAVYPAARHPRLQHAEYASALCRGCSSYDWDVPYETALRIAHGCSTDYPDRPDEPDELPCPECGELEWEGRMIESFLLEEPQLRRSEDAFEIVDFDVAGYGSSGHSSLCTAECRHCGNTYPLYSNDYLTGWWVAVHCDGSPDRIAAKLA